MAKQKKRAKKRHNNAPSDSPIKAQLKQFNWKRLVLIVLATAVAFGVYEALITINFLPVGGIPIIMHVYFVIVTVLLCAVLFFNSGISSKGVTPEMIRMSEDDDAEHLQAVCDKLNARKEIAKRLMLVLLPFLFAILFDVIYLFYGDFFAGAIAALGGRSQ